jgi:hypothetical protein
MEFVRIADKYDRLRTQIYLSFVFALQILLQLILLCLQNLPFSLYFVIFHLTNITKH